MKTFTTLLAGLCCFISLQVHAQYDYTPTGRNDVPVLGMQWGITGGGFTSMLNNRDDLNADQRLDPQMMNFTYAGGIEWIYWFQKTIGIGMQGLYWKGGAAYTGKDTISGLTLNAKTDMTYLKFPVLFHFKSYNRYYPDRRTRFSAFFGPYIALLAMSSDQEKLTNSAGQSTTYTIDNQNYEQAFSTGGATVKGKLNGGIYNPVDLGFIVGLGAEVRLWRRTVVGLHLRSDIGISNVEHTKGLKITYDSDPNKEYDFSPWNGMYAKYNMPNATDYAKGFVANRPPTKNMSAGIFLTIRKYMAY